MTFTSPLFLFLLLFLPLLIWLGRPSRGPSRMRELVSLGLRLLIALLLILGLAGLEIKLPANRLAVVFIVDASDSMTIPATVNTDAGPATITPRQLALAYVREALKNMPPDDLAGVILFGSEALVERPLSSEPELESFTSKITTLQTDLAEAIRLGLALLPADTARRMVILSDGLETTGDALEAAKLAAASGVEIRVLPFGVENSAEAILTSVRAPSRLRTDEEFSLEVSIESTREQTVGVRVLAGATIAYEGALKLNKGINNLTLPLVAGTPGFAAYRVQISPVAEGDTFYQNNELSAFSQIEGPPKVLVVINPTPRDAIDGSKELLQALQDSNILAEVVPPTGLPSELALLAEYASVILVDVPARDLTQRQMTAVQTYVRDLGGGLVVVGGPSAYGVGGYYKTPLEAALPVEMQIKDQQRFPKVTFVVIMDKSGSMSAMEGGVMKIRLAGEGAARVAELMHDFDEITVIAFDTSPVDVIGPLPGTQKEEAARLARSIGPGGGGIYVFDSLTFGGGIIRQSANATRHIILLSDGSDSEQQEGVRQLVQQFFDEGITLSVISIGSGPDTPFLEDIAAIGGGRFYLTQAAASIPDILTSEAAEVQRNYIIEETFFPAQRAPSPILSGISSIPSLQGYVGTTARETATTILVSQLADGNQDPILASWQYGLGKSVAWTSDATGRWAKNWVTWEDYARFWAQVVRYTLSTNAAANSNVRVTHTGEDATITVDAKSDQGVYLNGLTMLANVVGPDGATQAVTLQQIGPGQYSGEFTPLVEGAYLIRVAGSDPANAGADAPAVAQTSGWVLSYSPEYRTLASDPNFLLRLAQLTGGGGIEDSADIFKHNLTAPARATRPLWPSLLLLAVALLPLDIAVRRLVLTRYDLQRAWGKARAWFSLRPTPTAPPQRAEQLSSLFKAKDRAGSISSTKGTKEHEEGVVPPPIVIAPIKPDKADVPAPVVTAPPKPAPHPETQPQVPVATSTSSALLARKKAREKKTE